MDDCPFLTTSDEKVECFKECAFYKEKGNHNLCPFKRIELRKNSNPRVYDYAYMKDYEDEIIKHYKKYSSANF